MRLSRQEKPQGRIEGPVIEPHKTNILRYAAHFEICSVIWFIYMRKKNQVGQTDNLFLNDVAALQIAE